METYGLIMAGGVGERFWPLSRRKMPKQFLNLSGKDYLVNETIKRLFRVCESENIFVITNEQQVENMYTITANLLNRGQILSEPVSRNTAACIGYAAVRIVKEFGDGIMIISPSDSYVRDNDKFIKTINLAIDAAKNTDSLVTVGIQPTFPATGYGYIRYCKGNCPIKKVISFIEKPDMEHAMHFLTEGDYLWNSGIFVWKASVILEKIKKYLHDSYELLEKIGKNLGTENETQIINEVYSRIRPVSIDHGIMEKANGILVVPGDFGWCDVGSWDMISAFYKPDQDGNIIVGDHIGHETHNSVVFTKDRIVATVGLEDIIVVDSDDVILVCKKDRAQDVKEIVHKLRMQNREDLL